MTLKTELVQLMPGLIIALVLFSPFYLSSFSYNFLPKYYGGDPNYSIEQNEELRKESTERFRQNFPEFSDKNLFLELPPKAIDKRIQSLLGLSFLFGILWGLYWSIYAFIHKKSFKSKNIVWITYAVYITVCIILLLVIFYIAGAGLRGQ